MPASAALAFSVSRAGTVTAAPAAASAPPIAAAAAGGAELVLSGLLAGDVPGVLAAYRGQGFALARRLDIDGWATLLLRRGGAQPLPRDDDDEDDPDNDD